MAGEIEVNSFKNIQLKAFAQAADQDGNYKLDSVEKKLFENLVEQAGLSMEDEFSSVMGEAASNVPDAKIQKKQEQNAEKAEKQRYKAAFGKSYNEETMASVRSLEAEANTRVGNAFKEMKEYVDPKTLAAHIAKRPDVSKFNSVTDYTAALTRWVDGMEALKTKTTIEVVETGNEKLSEQMSTEHAKQNEQMTNRFDSLDEQLKGIAETVRADLIIDLQDLEIDKKSLNLEQRILKATQRISKDIKDIKAIQQQIRSLVIQDLMVDRADLAVDLRNLYETRYYGKENLSETRRQGEQTRETVDKKGNEIKEYTKEQIDGVKQQIEEKGNEVIDTLDPLYVNRAIKGLRDAAVAAGKSVAEFVKDNPELLFLGIPGGMLLARMIR